MFLQDVNNDLGKAQERLNRNAYGFDIDKKENAQKVYDRESQIIRDKNENEIIDLQIQNNLSVDYVKAQREKKNIDANFAKAMIKDLESVPVIKPTELESITEYNVLMDKLTSLKKKEWAWREASFDDRANFRSDVLTAHATGLITNKQKSQMLDPTATKYYDDPNVVNAIDAITENAQQYPTEESKSNAEGQMRFALMDKIMKGMNPTEALDETVTERIEADYPGYKAEDMIETAKFNNLKLFQVYALLQSKVKK